MTLLKKSLTDLRAIAQSYSIPDIFQKTNIQLIQAIELKQQDMLPKHVTEIPKPEYDARLMLKPPARMSNRALIEEALQPYIERGLHVSFDDETWSMKFGKRSDTGTLRQPLRNILQCAGKVLA
jgi:hypothetical protein